MTSLQGCSEKHTHTCERGISMACFSASCLQHK